MSDAPVAVVVVNWNHRRFLGECLEALRTQGQGLQVIVVDNGSTDGSPEWIADHYPEVRLLAFPDNRGFSRAFNAAVHRTDAPWVLSLNPDVTVRPGFVAALVHAAARDARIGIVAPKLLWANNPTLLDSTGLFIDRRRRPYDRGQGEMDRGQYDAQTDVFGASGAAALYRRAMLEDVAPEGEYLDEDFFAYYEDADLSWRARLRGWRCVYAPEAVATHVRGWGDTLRKRGHAAKESRGPRLALRNRYLMTLKNDAWRYVMADLPWILAAELPRLLYAALTVPGALLGLFDLARAWPAALRKRRAVRSRRTIDDALIRRWFVAPANVQ
ncbi:MAG: glycosyltransferase family 2 protein [Anaerolineae bacterium]|nr:glycosyltransferase family 2 protein [Anaerolineae bacterium]